MSLNFVIFYHPVYLFFSFYTSKTGESVNFYIDYCLLFLCFSD
ncbi:hypothetical protein CHCC20335_3094 [Bacillus paralicheniformis]|nr:hypothetical protein CHCC20335_3094 [Bacillus paralicheniformis]